MTLPRSLAGNPILWAGMEGRHQWGTSSSTLHWWRLPRDVVNPLQAMIVDRLTDLHPELVARSMAVEFGEAAVYLWSSVKGLSGRAVWINASCSAHSGILLRRRRFDLITLFGT